MQCNDDVLYKKCPVCNNNITIRMKKCYDDCDDYEYYDYNPLCCNLL